MRYLILMVFVALTASCAQKPLTPLQEAREVYKSGDYATAFARYKPLAEAGDSDAQFYMGYMYNMGLGGSKNNFDAVVWYCRSAVGGDRAAISNLGYMRFNGLGISRNKRKALMWSRMAAALDDARGQYRLGQNYMRGAYVQKDLEKAYLWLTLAHLHSFKYDRDAALFLDDIEQQLTPDQIEAGDKAVKQWKASTFDGAMADRIRASDACSATLRAYPSH